ncbi:MAG TPA: HD domain-containing protein [Candidatus Saccharimonadales bacterium]|nr:HD domain-containing protein [Candidatus Saccharimonadales bacterium]
MRPHNTLFSLQQMILDLAAIHRDHMHVGSERHENDIEHSFTVGLLCWFICEHHKLNLDQAKILKYAMAHDFVERYAGDTNTYASDSERQRKTKLEKVALERLSREFSDFENLVEIMQAYEAKADDEALFVWTVDKMQQLILGDMDNWRPYRKINITYEQFEQKVTEHLGKASPHCKEIFSELLAYCKTTYYDRP